MSRQWRATSQSRWLSGLRAGSRVLPAPLPHTAQAHPETAPAADFRIWVDTVDRLTRQACQVGGTNGSEIYSLRRRARVPAALGLRSSRRASPRPMLSFCSSGSRRRQVTGGRLLRGARRWAKTEPPFPRQTPTFDDDSNAILR
jgi:hypothetical protein